MRIPLLLLTMQFLCVWQFALAQEKEISGKVTSQEDGNALPGVNVVVKGTSTGTITDVEGKFSLNVSDPNATLVFSYIGFATQEVALGNRTTVTIGMLPDLQSLNEVVVVGYGTQRKSDLTGAISSITAQELKQVPIVSLDQGLQGRAAGVQVTQASAAPGGGVSVRVRGGNSITGGNEPLYVIDGFPVYNDNGAVGAQGSGRGGIAQNALAAINPNDIESIEVLKDASATAIYGSRGANGVVLITTKRGKAGETRVDYEGYYGVQTIRNKIELLSGPEFAEMVNEARRNDGEKETFGLTDSQGNLVDPRFPAPSQVVSTDWQDEIFRDAPIQNHQLTLSGGSEKAQFAVSGNYFDQNGILQGSRFQRGSFRANIDSKIGEKINVGTRLTYSRLVSNIGQSEGDGGGSAGAINAALVIAPTFPVRYDDGIYPNNDIPNGSTIGNPVATAFLTKDVQLTDRLLGSVFADYQILKGLNFRVSFGTDLSNATRDIYHPQATIVGSGTGGRAAQSRSNLTSYLNENILTYSKSFGNIHQLNITAGYTRQKQVRSFNRIEVNGFINDILENNNLDAGQSPLPPSSGKNQWTLASWLGRVFYSFNDRYLLTLTGRADGSSKFGAGNKWAFFPSVALAWRISQEGFMDRQNVFSDLKLRTSYGITGNAEIGLYQSLARLGNHNYAFNNNLISGIGPASIANQDLKWETTSQYDVGVDFGFLDNRLTATADIYYKKTEDLLLNATLPFTSGFSTALLNSGSIENKGFEVSVGYDVFVGEFKWRVNANLAMNRNKILSLGESEAFYASSVSGHLKTKGSWLEVGLPVGVWKEWVYDGVFQDQAQLDAGPVRPGDKLGYARFKDINDDGVINADDRVIVGDPNPDFIYGITNNFSFKRFELNMFIQGVQGNEIRNVLRQEIDQISPWGNQMRATALRRWTPANPNTDVPIASRFNGAAVESSRQIEDGSFARLRNITLSYTLPQFKFVRNARVYISGINLVTLTKYTGYDPEVNSQGQSNVNLGVDYNAYPASKSVLVGVNLGF